MMLNGILLILTCCLITESASRAVWSTWSSTKQCYDCKSHNKKWGSDYCVNAEEDCGECIEGYTFGKDGNTCITKDEILVSKQESAIVPKGSNIIIQCHFETVVDCVWKRRDSLMGISRRYSYLNGNGERTTDCSIKINDFKQHDIGNWSCETYANSEHGVLHSTITWLTLWDSTTIIMKKNDTALIPEGESVRLLCHFPMEVYCAWRRRDRYVDIRGRYTFVDSRANGRMVKDCSIFIKNFQHFDIGQWDCESEAMAETNGIRVASMELKLVHHLTLVTTSEDQIAAIGEKITLSCQFNNGVTCNWAHNGVSITPFYNYDFITDIMTRNCDLEIMSVSESDYGNWTCSHKKGNSGTASYTVKLKAPEIATAMTLKYFQISVADATGANCPHVLFSGIVLISLIWEIFVM